MQVRAARLGELDTLAQLWFDGWQDAHAAILPAALTAARTLPSFRDRLEAGLDRSYVAAADDAGGIAGFYMLKGRELYQFFVARAARGTGLAAALIDDAEGRLRRDGVAVAFLNCAIGNDRAARFYEKRGWERRGVIVEVLDTITGPFELEVWRYEKRLP
jgi:GNAT superfamily N-acetyltransferase